VTRGSRSAPAAPAKASAQPGWRFPKHLDASKPGSRAAGVAAAARGAVTAEFAVALPAVVLLLGLLLAGSAAGLTQLRLEEAARAGARALARGEDAAAVGGIVRQLAGDSALAAVASDGVWLSVTASGTVSGAMGPLVPWTLTAKAWARSESPDAPALSAPATADLALGWRA
jgi:hypothetical protein